ncbi:hypothetical protein TRFO_39710 [Tritrichomonas foetus]|uniref:Initiator binding domain-containing protein n=1 Tax=Tritrichomonas foetus TaxID=1144522 RepID=A0A1J4J8R1_9EUKA|nr:hypothetical protein TRFO_39710 [Tritrichomonas foetus]|eukprot:OHS94075.1 hypothetical protein TRFO_39710 [Tritrichomonas foetus]
MTASDLHLPQSYWNQLSQDDKNEFLRLRTNFHHGQKISSKDRRIVTFRKELLIVLNYLERGQENMETRCVLTGVCFAGPLVCVNTRQLKSFLSRCKSSINGSFQQLGFVALRTKAKAKSCVVAVLPSLENHQNILRQWTVRYTSVDAQFCFVSSYPYSNLPEITEDDLFDEKKGQTPEISVSQPAHPFYQQMGSLSPVAHLSPNHLLQQNLPQSILQNLSQNLNQNPNQTLNNIQHNNLHINHANNNLQAGVSNNANNLQGNVTSMNLKSGNSGEHIFAPLNSRSHVPLRTRTIDFDLPSFEDFLPEETASTPPLFKTSFSMDFKDFQNDEDEWESSPIAQDKHFMSLNTGSLMKRSESAQVTFNFFDDDNFYY